MTHFGTWSITSLRLARQRAAARLADAERRSAAVRGTGQLCWGCIAGDCDGELQAARAYVADLDAEIAARVDHV